jgi:hypothetical protein
MIGGLLFRISKAGHRLKYGHGVVGVTELATFYIKYRVEIRDSSIAPNLGKQRQP